MSLFCMVWCFLSLVAADPSCKDDAQSCAKDAGPTLLQKKTGLDKRQAVAEATAQLSEAAVGSNSSRKTRGPPSTGCGRRLNHYSVRPSACIVVRDSKALLVKVPYGSRPGWDFPGGMVKGNEPACETAERETCEETGYAVKAVRKLTYNVFLCQVIGSNVCRKSVDEGFLRRRWISRGEIDSIRYRGGTWGDKRGLLKRYINSGSGGSTSGPRDACGCFQGQGWSSRANECTSSSQTSNEEGAACQANGGLDECGCRRASKGWSSTKGRCSSSSQTSASEAAACGNGGNAVDACGCRIGVEGWSTTRGRCSSSSTTSSSEAEQCRRSALMSVKVA